VACSLFATSIKNKLTGWKEEQTLCSHLEVRTLRVALLYRVNGAAAMMEKKHDHPNAPELLIVESDEFKYK
jgi:hypothetical protein